MIGRLYYATSLMGIIRGRLLVRMLAGVLMGMIGNTRDTQRICRLLRAIRCNLLIIMMLHLGGIREYLYYIHYLTEEQYLQTECQYPTNRVRCVNHKETYK